MDFQALFENIESNHSKRESHLRTAIAYVIFCTLLAFSTVGQATVYYVDAHAGNDKWSGRLPNPTTPPSIDGPWRTLVRVNQQGLIPGDEVRLRCGQAWKTGLRINSSGSPSNPIRIKGYPAPCTLRPQVSGLIRIPTFAWKRGAGNSFTTQFPINIVRNGELWNSIEGWQSWSAQNDAEISFVKNCPESVTGCLRLNSASGSNSYVISANFPVDVSETFILSYTLRAPAGTEITANIRRSASNSYSVIGASETLVASGTWERRVSEVLIADSDATARLDFRVSGANGDVYIRNVSLKRAANSLKYLSLDGRILQQSHHPNLIAGIGQSGIPYFKNAANSNVVATTNGQGSTYLTMGSDAIIPGNPANLIGAEVLIRSSDWNIDRRTVVNVESSRLYLDSPTRYPILEGYGYMLVGKQWMVDSPDEWNLDASNSTLTVWMPDGLAPGDRVFYTTEEYGVDLSNQSHIELKDISVEGTVTGIAANNSENILISNVRVQNVSGLGVSLVRTNDSTVLDSIFFRTGLDAIGGCKEATITCGVRNVVSGNTINESGVITENEQILSLPAPVYSTIGPGLDSTITENSIETSAATGVFAFGVTEVSNNYISDSCLIVDDCGAIYLNKYASHSSVTDNLILTSHGNLSGTNGESTHAVGVYLDEQATGVNVTGNFIVDADYGIQIHNAYANIVDSNIAFGNRKAQLWLQEQTNDTRPDGDVYDNVVSNNTFFPLSNFAPVVLQSYLGNTHDFASFVSNTYSTLLGSIVVIEDMPTAVTSHTFTEWQAATWQGISRGLDIDGNALEMGAYTAFAPHGENMLDNGDLTDGLTGWHVWNELAPYSAIQLSTGTIGNSIRVASGGSQSILSAPNFSIDEGNWYRVSFDARTGRDGQTISVLPRRGGDESVGYEPLSTKKFVFSGTTAWTRFSFFFQSAKTVIRNDPITGDLGARIDFTNIAASDSLQVTNLEIVPLEPVDEILKIRLLSNSSSSTGITVPCPEPSKDIQLCSKYVSSIDNSPIIWPRYLAPLTGEVIYTRDESLFDSDRDGIPDVSDTCPATLSGNAVNSQGCALWQ